MSNLTESVPKKALMVIAIAALATLATPSAKAACHPSGSVQPASFLRPARAHLLLAVAALGDVCTRQLSGRYRHLVPGSVGEDGAPDLCHSPSGIQL